MMQSRLNAKLLISGELGINPLLFDSNIATFDLSREEYDAVEVLVKGGNSISRLLSSVSDSLGGVVRSQGSIPESMNINIMSTGNHECGKVNKSVSFSDSLLNDVDIAKSAGHDSNEAMKVCKDNIVDWPGSDVYINYTDKTTNVQTEVMGKFITAEACVTLNPQCARCMTK